MATYLKRTSKLFDLSLWQPSADVNLRDLMCPVCRGILIEPVTLPCTHNLCLRCLKGTFEHNSLSCPLCRLRVGSWLRTATKSETLVNHGLWEFIRTKFPKEVEDKHNGEERDHGLDADFETKKIFSAAGEIRREYEAQLQMAEEEMRRQRQAQQIASEALIQKIHAEEEQQLLVQLAQDQLLAKSLAKKQVAEKQKGTPKCYNECLNTSVTNYTFDASKFNVTRKDTHVNNVETPQNETTHLGSKRMSLPESVRDSSEIRRANMVLLSSIRSERYCKAKMNASNTYKNCCPKQLAVYNVVNKSFKQQAVPKYFQPCTSNYSMDPGCSTSKTYSTETKEELRVPSDVVNSKKKSLGVEVCMTHGSLGSHRVDDDERIGSAESSGSHDSINQEIHHFKPIKTVPRTSLKISSDGKQIDPKLIRVVPIMKKAINAVLKAPSPTHLKRIIGCSWSAFRGKARQNAREKQAAYNRDVDAEAPIDQKPSTSLNQSLIVSSKMTKQQINDARLDFVQKSSFDNNKNYTKNTNKIVNGTKMSKKLPSSESDARTTRKSWRTRVRNGMIAKSKRRNAWVGRKCTDLTLADVTGEENDPTNDSGLPCGKTSPLNDEQDGSDDVAIENIAERIKRRKLNGAERKTSKTTAETEFDATPKRSMRKRMLSERREESPTVSDQAHVSSSTENVRLDKKSTGTKRRRMCGTSRGKTKKNALSTNVTSGKATTTLALKRSARIASSTKIPSKVASNESDGKFNYDSPPESCDEIEECISDESTVADSRVHEKHDDSSDEEVIKEQQRIERILLQEREDYELARRLQAKFDEMERVAGRTRRSKKVVDDTSFSSMDAREACAAETVPNARNSRTKRPLVVRTAKTVPKKKRGRPPKRVKGDEMRAR